MLLYAIWFSQSEVVLHSIASIYRKFWRTRLRMFLRMVGEYRVTDLGNQILALVKLEVFSDDNFNVAQMVQIFFGRKHNGKRIKTLVTSTFSFSHNVVQKVS